jgi:hypothetical protein
MMPRTSRSVAQRLASQSKSRKRRPRAPISTSAPLLDQTLAAGGTSDVESEAAANPLPPPAPEPIGGAPRRRSDAPPVERSASTSTRSRVGSAARSSIARTASRLATPRRSYAEYAAEYAYVAADLRRIALVAVVLIVLLVALSFVIQ